jgi:hypothetical protein
LQIFSLQLTTPLKAQSGVVIDQKNQPKNNTNSLNLSNMAPPNADLSHTPTTTTAIPAPLFKVNSPNVQYTEEHILSKYTYFNTLVTKQSDGSLVAEPTETVYEFKTERTVPRVG